MPSPDILFQAFYWDTVAPQGETWWTHLAKQVPALADLGMGALWIPPPCKGGAGAGDMGYGPYDLYDLGSKDQKGTVATRFGTKEQLLDLVATAHRHGLKVYADVILNHADGADYAEPNPVMEKLGWSDIPGDYTVRPEHRSPEAKPGDTLRSWTGFAPKGADGRPGSGRFPRTWRDFHPNEAEPDRAPPYHLKEFGQDYAFRDGNGDYVRHSLIAWAHWFVAQTGIDGYRLDDLKGVEPDMTADFLERGPDGLWAVGEYFDGDPGKVMDYYRAAHGCTRIFDFPLYYALREMTFQPERFDMRDLLRHRLPERDMAVPFAGSHDVSRNEMALLYNAPLAYAVILAMSGTPVVYYSDLWRAGKDQRERLTRLMRARHLADGDEIARWEDKTVLALERRGSLLVAFHSGGVAEARTVTVETDFGPHVRLRDHAGDSKPLETDAQGRLTLTLEPGDYVYYAPTGKKRPPPRPLPTRQTWEFADDLDTGKLGEAGKEISITLVKGQAVTATLTLDEDAPGEVVLVGPGGGTLGRDARQVTLGSMPGDGTYTVRVRTTGDAPAHGTLTVER